MNTSEMKPAPGYAIFLSITALVCGAAVMTIEVLGARLMGPFFGVSVFVWTALIGVTLLALAVGYALGGHAADRRPAPDLMFAAILIAGVLVCAVPSLKLPVLQAAAALGLRWGAVISAMVMFALPLTLLGAVSPYLLRISAHETARLGRTAGLLYALSTIGSFAGTLATGFFLIGLLGISRIFLLTGALLVCVAVFYFARYRARWFAAAALLWPLVLLFGDPASRHHTMADGTRVELVHGHEGFYGNVQVVEYEHGDMHTRELVIDGLVQGGIDLRTRASVYEYAYLLQHVPTMLRPGGTRCLMIGLGAGIVPSWYQRRGVHTDAVDIDPAVAAAAQAYFALDEGVSVFIEDARAFLARTTTRYDYLLIDVFNGDLTPTHLLSLEAMRLARSRMTDRGVLALNLVGDAGPQGEMTAAVVRTLREVFDHVEVRPAFVPEAQTQSGNFVVVAYSGDPATVDAQTAEQLPVHRLAQTGVRYGLTHAVQPQARAAEPLTDDFNPIDVRDLALKEQVRSRILDSTPWALLLGG